MTFSVAYLMAATSTDVPIVTASIVLDNLSAKISDKVATHGFGSLEARGLFDDGGISESSGHGPRIVNNDGDGGSGNGKGHKDRGSGDNSVLGAGGGTVGVGSGGEESESKKLHNGAITAIGDEDEIIFDD